eukprot:g112.t1
MRSARRYALLAVPNPLAGDSIASIRKRSVELRKRRITAAALTDSQTSVRRGTWFGLYHNKSKDDSSNQVHAEEEDDGEQWRESEWLQRLKDRVNPLSSSFSDPALQPQERPLLRLEETGRSAEEVAFPCFHHDRRVDIREPPPGARAMLFNKASGGFRPDAYDNLAHRIAGGQVPRDDAKHASSSTESGEDDGRQGQKQQSMATLQSSQQNKRFLRRRRRSGRPSADKGSRPGAVGPGERAQRANSYSRKGSTLYRSTNYKSPSPRPRMKETIIEVLDHGAWDQMHEARVSKVKQQRAERQKRQLQRRRRQREAARRVLAGAAAPKLAENISRWNDGEPVNGREPRKGEGDGDTLGLNVVAVGQQRPAVDQATKPKEEEEEEENAQEEETEKEENVQDDWRERVAMERRKRSELAQRMLRAAALETQKKMNLHD